MSTWWSLLLWGGHAQSFSQFENRYGCGGFRHCEAWPRLEVEFLGVRNFAIEMGDLFPFLHGNPQPAVLGVISPMFLGLKTHMFHGFWGPKAETNSKGTCKWMVGIRNTIVSFWEFAYFPLKIGCLPFLPLHGWVNKWVYKNSSYLSNTEPFSTDSMMGERVDMVPPLCLMV